MEEALTISQQIEQAMDGRTQRWLSMKIGVHESDLSKKLSGKMGFTSAEIKKINDVLRVAISTPNKKNTIRKKLKNKIKCQKNTN